MNEISKESFDHPHQLSQKRFQKLNWRKRLQVLYLMTQFKIHL